MDRIFYVVLDVLDELRIDLQDVFWLLCQQLNIDGTIIQASDQLLLFVAGKKHGRKRSLVRRIASRLPLKPIPRIHFTIVDPDGESNSDYGSKLSFQGLATIPMLDHEEKIELWKEKQKERPKIAVSLGNIVDSDDDEIESIRSVTPPSICADSLYSSQSTVDTVAMNKISALEDELARLREQIAKIVNVQTTQQLTSDYGSLPSTPVPPPPPPPPCPPPLPPLTPSNSLLPPPPPPPPLPSVMSSTPNDTPRKLSLAESLQTANLRSTSSQSQISRKPSMPSMTDILKDMGKVKLKKVDRSVSTPAKSQQNRESDDPATIIAMALRKRFAQMNQMCDSPEREDREERDSFSDANDNTHITPKYTPKLKAPSPRKLFVRSRPELTETVLTNKENVNKSSPAPFGQHMLRKTTPKS